MELVRLGKVTGPVSERIECIVDARRQDGFMVRTYADVERLMWEKLICNVAFSAPCAITGLTMAL